MERTTEETIRHWRQTRGLSVSELARVSGVHRSTLTRWESGQSQPSVVELERVFDVLEVSVRERQAYWRQIDRPRAFSRLRSEDSTLPMAIGDLLRALRLRADKTQTEVARQAGITQGMLARWENSASLPDNERLHMLCFVLDASVEEAAALTVGSRNLEPLPTTSDDLYESLNRLVFMNFSTHKDLMFLAHAAQFQRLIREGYASPYVLAEVWGRQAHHVQWRLGRDEDAIRYGNAALTIVTASKEGRLYNTFEAHFTATITAMGKAWARKSGPAAGYRFLMQWEGRIQQPLYLHWVQSDIAHYLSLMGETHAAVSRGAEVLQKAQRYQEELRGDFLNRMWDYVKLLLQVGNGETALDVLSRHSIFPSPHYDISDHINEMLLTAEARVLVGQKSEAQVLLGTVQAHTVRLGLPYQERLKRVSHLLQA